LPLLSAQVTGSMGFGSSTVECIVYRDLTILKVF
jgi:hypothetical protein